MSASTDFDILAAAFLTADELGLDFTGDGDLISRQGVLYTPVEFVGLVEARLAYSEDQARDDRGRWGEGLGDGNQPENTGANLTARNYEGEVGNRDHVTRSEEGTVPTSAIADLKGVNGEQPGQHGARQREGDNWSRFVDSVRENGITSPIFITVDYGQAPKISEGNTWRDAAVELGLKDVPVEIRYFGHAEEQGTVVDRARQGSARLGYSEDQSRDDHGRFGEGQGDTKADATRDGKTPGSVTKDGKMIVADGKAVGIGDKVSVTVDTQKPGSLEIYRHTVGGKIEQTNGQGLGIKLKGDGTEVFRPEDVTKGAPKGAPPSSQGTVSFFVDHGVKVSDLISALVGPGTAKGGESVSRPPVGPNVGKDINALFGAARLGYSEDQPRDERGRFGEGSGDTHAEMVATEGGTSLMGEAKPLTPDEVATILDSERRIKDALVLGGNAHVNLMGVNPALAPMIADRIESVTREFPAVRDSLRGVQVASLSSGDLGQYSSTTGTIQLNEQMFGQRPFSPESPAPTLWEDRRTGVRQEEMNGPRSFHPLDDAQSTMDHELGHAVWDAASLQMNGAGGRMPENDMSARLMGFDPLLAESKGYNFPGATRPGVEYPKPESEWKIPTRSVTAALRSMGSTYGAKSYTAKTGMIYAEPSHSLNEGFAEWFSVHQREDLRSQLDERTKPIIGDAFNKVLDLAKAKQPIGYAAAFDPEFDEEWTCYGYIPSEAWEAMTTAEKDALFPPVLDENGARLAYSEDQARDERGRWGEGGAGLGPEARPGEFQPITDWASRDLMHGESGYAPWDRMPQEQREAIDQYAQGWGGERGTTYGPEGSQTPAGSLGEMCQRADDLLAAAQDNPGEYIDGYYGWYAREGDNITGAFEGMSLTPEQGFGLVAACSGNSRWNDADGTPLNINSAVELATMFEENPQWSDRDELGNYRMSSREMYDSMVERYGTSTPRDCNTLLPSHFNNARAVLDSDGSHDGVYDALSGQKVSTFYDQFASRGEGDHATIDTIMVKALSGNAHEDGHILDGPGTGRSNAEKEATSTFTRNEGGTGTATTYAMFDTAVAVVAEAHGLSVSDAQAVIWGQFRGY